MSDSDEAIVADVASAPDQARSRANRGYPLSLLFIIVAGAAIVISQLIPLGPAVMDERVPVPLLVGFSVVFGVIAMFLGTFIGSMSSRRVMGALHGALVGILIGPVIGPLALIPRDDLARTLWSVFGGCLLIIGLAAVARLSQQPARELDENEFDAGT